MIQKCDLLTHQVIRHFIMIHKRFQIRQDNPAVRKAGEWACSHIKHVVQKWYASITFTYSCPVQIDLHIHAGLFRDSRDVAYT